MSRSEITAKVRTFLVQEFLQGDDTNELTDTTSLRESGILDSMGIVKVVVHVEREFGFEIEPHDASDENLGTIAKIVAYIERRTA